MNQFKTNLIREKIEYLSLTLESIHTVDNYFAKSKMVKNIMYNNLKKYFNTINEFENLINYYISLENLIDEDTYDNLGIDIKEKIYEIIDNYMDLIIDYNEFFSENDMTYLDNDDKLFNNDLIYLLDKIENTILTKYDVKTFLVQNNIGTKEFYEHIDKHKTYGIYSLNVVKNNDLLNRIIITTNDNYNLENRLKELEYYVKAYYMYFYINREFNFDFEIIEDRIKELKNEYLDKVGIKKENKNLRKKIGDRNER